MTNVIPWSYMHIIKMNPQLSRSLKLQCAGPWYQCYVPIFDTDVIKNLNRGAMSIISMTTVPVMQVHYVWACHYGNLSAPPWRRSQTRCPVSHSLYWDPWSEIKYNHIMNTEIHVYHCQHGHYKTNTYITFFVKKNEAHFQNYWSRWHQCFFTTGL